MKKDKIMKIVIFAVILLIPIIYSFFYLKSYWDPYGNLTDMKIAIVNLDKGEDEKNEGKEFVQSIKDSNVFNICEVDEKDANKGMQDGKYYATITIPSNFTESLNSASSTDKQIAQITYSPNQATNYLATQIVNSAVKTMETSLEEKISGKVVETLSDKLEEVPNSLEKTSEGAKEILEGSRSLNSGLKNLNDGISTLNNSYNEFDNGLKSASEGSKTLDSGITQVNSGVSSLNSGATSLDSAISQVKSGVDALSSQSTSGITTLVNGLTSVNTGAENLDTGITGYVTGVNNYITGVDTYVTNVNELLNVVINSQDPSLQTFKQNAQLLLRAGETINKNSANAKTLSASGSELKQGSSSLYAGTQQLKSGASNLTTLANGLTSLPTYLSQIKEGSEELKNGISTLSAGTKSLKTGSNNLLTGLDILSSSSSIVKTALNSLQSGMQSAYDGSTKLVTGTQTFNKEINKGIDETKEQLKNLHGLKEFVENPVDFNTKAYGEVNSYGIAFTPLFLSIGLWVGALMCYVVLYYDQKNRFGIFGSHNKNKLLQNLLYIGLGAVQGVITGALLKLGLGFEIQNIALYYLASLLIGITFMSIVQSLIRNFGDVGKFLALIILVLQLAASGGTFPIETISKGFQPLSAYLPMTYAIKLLREILVPTATNLKGTYISILLCITAFTLIITYIVDIIRNKKETKKV